MERIFNGVVAVLAAWCGLLSWYCYALTRETQRMLCHAAGRDKSVLECRTSFTGDTVAQLVVLGVGCALAVVVLAVVCLRKPKAAESPSEG